jgi:hypothetical protein
MCRLCLAWYWTTACPLACGHGDGASAALRELGSLLQCVCAASPAVALRVNCVAPLLPLLAP